MSKRQCKFDAAPGGCRKGVTCTFRHGNSPQRFAQSPGTSTASIRQGNATSGPSSSARSVPPGHCKYYWTTGSCNRDFGCHFKHIAQSSIVASLSQQQLATGNSSAIDVVAPFMTPTGMARLTRSRTDVSILNVEKNYSPSETHNALQKYLQDRFRFTSSVDIYAFVMVISGATERNTLWEPDDGQLLLSTIASGNALFRIDEILQWASVSTQAGHSRTTLSFQRGFLPLLSYYTSSFVVKSTRDQLVNALYMRLMENFERFAQVVEECMAQVIVARSFRDPLSSVTKIPSGFDVFMCLANILYEFLTRFKDAVPKQPRSALLVRNLQEWSKTWDFSAEETSTAISAAQRSNMMAHMNSRITRVLSIIEREERKLDPSKGRDQLKSSRIGISADDGVIAALLNSYEGPGELREQGPRHDNDFVDINYIRVAPTHGELTSHTPPFLPANLYDAPHPSPPGSMERLMDVQFRLLREELTAPLRTAVQLVLEDLEQSKPRKSRLSEILGKHGGKYRGQSDQQDGILFDVYTNVELITLVPERRGITVSVELDTPPGRARAAQVKTRVQFWEGVSGKRLMQGGLVALIWKSRHRTDVFLGTIASPGRELANAAKNHTAADRIPLRIMFFDSEITLKVMTSTRSTTNDIKIMLESPVMFEAVRPFLEALRVEPESLPFAKYIAHHPHGVLNSIKIDPPKFALRPDFCYQLSSLFPEEAGVIDLKLIPTNADSVAAARQALLGSRLDPSQVEAVVNTLTRELSLIQGPPGTGKSFTGVELIRVLLQNNIGPILLIAFTNHALDHMLHSVLEAGITKRIVRLGSRSADEKMQQYSLDTLEMIAGNTRLDRSFGHHHRALKDIREQLVNLMKKWSKTEVDPEEIQDYLQIQYPEHFEHIFYPPRWIPTIRKLSLDANDGGPWHHVGKNRKREVEDDSMYSFWRYGGDLDFIRGMQNEKISAPQPQLLGIPTTLQPQNRYQALGVDVIPNPIEEAADPSISDDEDDDDVIDILELEPWQIQWITPAISDTSASIIDFSPAPMELGSPIPDTHSFETHVDPAQSDVMASSDFLDLSGFLQAIGYEGLAPSSSSDRPLETLLMEGVMWSLSLTERERLHKYWEDSVRNYQLDDFEKLREKHARALTIYNEGRDEIRRSLLRNVQIVGCTTTGAANLTRLLKGLSPQVMLVEEAGQVLEAHVLGSLVPSVEHLILIGDPLQLRPTLNNFSLSMDNRLGRKLYRFDMSLMERLDDAGLPMTQINTQRRMRPKIANLVRNTLYPNLVDHELVKQYPPVRGISKNIFFFSHSHPEKSGEDSGSRYNTFEVAMIKDLVLYLLRQGCYSQEGDIVVLCAYLGQLAKVRDALSHEVAIVIDERDQAALDDQEGDKDENESAVAIEHVKVSKRVRLRTVDNYQGEEAKIVILSLVRNSGSSGEELELVGHTAAARANIGFLKSKNRTNVALSRAKEGLYILGNATNMASRSRMWQSVIEELEKQQAIGDAFPIACHQHPDSIVYVSQPGILPRQAPDGGCLKSCNAKLKCGHLCPYKCHPDDPAHVTVECVQQCVRLCPRGHPCSKQCAEACADCTFPGDVELSCGHTKSRVPCHLWDNPEDISCEVMVEKLLPNCHHVAEMPCSGNPEEFRCNAPCGGILSCCGRDCNARCHQCKVLDTEGTDHDQDRAVLRKHHNHPCQKTLFCEHRCPLPCSQDHQCATICRSPCRQACPHAKCNRYCSDPCAPCQAECTWKCEHFSCPVPCGSICARLPCDRRCVKRLGCGHQCPSVCGEPCSIQVCPTCAKPEWKSRTVDLVLNRTLEDVDPDMGTLDELLIRLPNCEHVFTVETLDGVCGMGDFYHRMGEDGKWLGLKEPPHDFQKPPVCPTCRVAITSPRYGRIFKRADLDVLERNVASRLSQSLNDLNQHCEKLSRQKAEVLLKEEAKSARVTGVSTKRKAQMEKFKKQMAIRKKKRETSISAQSIDPGNKDLYDISPVVVGIWRKATKDLTAAYEKACSIAATRSAHTSAWQSAFAYLYRHEMEISASDPSRAPRKPEEYAMRLARMQVGQSPPLADKKYAVEAILLTIQIRSLLLDLARTWLDAIKDASRPYPQDQLQHWATFGLFLADSCIDDANLALAIAEESESRHQITRSSLYRMRAGFERFQFNVDILTRSGRIKEERDRMVDSAIREKLQAEEYVNDVLKEHRAVKAGGEEEDWLSENFTSTALKITEGWAKMERSLTMATFYQPVTLEDQISVIKGMKFSHTGHFYRCPNGHVFVIGECGGAMQVSKCNECGAQIGGRNHQLDSTNAPAQDLEELARAQGAGQSPFNWARWAQ